MAGFEPQQYAGYRLEERISVGESAELFRARRDGATGGEQEVLLKRFLPGFCENGVRVAALRESVRLVSRPHWP